MTTIVLDHDVGDIVYAVITNRGVVQGTVIKSAVTIDSWSTKISYTILDCIKTQLIVEPSQLFTSIDDALLAYGSTVTQCS